MEIIDTKLPDCKILIPKKFEDARGYFFESWNRTMLRTHGLDIDFVQDNQSFSAVKGTVRGLHYQSPPHAQDKLVRVVVGKILDIAVDVRVGSPTYGQWIAMYLSAENNHQLLVPKGFLHGFATCEDKVLVTYKCSDVYSSPAEGSVRFDDPELGIDWELDRQAILSEKDSKAGSFADFQSPFVYQG